MTRIVKNFYILFLTALVLLHAVPGFADEERAALTLLSEEQITIGAPFDVALTVYHPRKKPPVLPGEEDFSPFTLRSTSVKKKRVEKNLARTLAVYTLAIYRTGTFEVPPLQISVDGRTVRTEPLEITVLSVLPPEEDKAELRDINPPYPARLRPFVVPVVLLCIAACVFLYFFLHRFFVKKPLSAGEETIPEAVFDPYAVSMKELKNLKQSWNDEKINEKTVYSALSHVLRLYFGSLLRIRALDMTTTEIKRHIRRVKRTGFIQKPVQLLNLLKKSDMVKFAKEKPNRKTVEEDIDGSISIIREARAELEGEDARAV